MLAGAALAAAFACMAEQDGWRPLFDGSLSNAVFDPSVWSRDADGCLTAEKDVAIWTGERMRPFRMD